MGRKQQKNVQNETKKNEIKNINLYKDKMSAKEHIGLKSGSNFLFHFVDILQVLQRGFIITS